MSCNGPNKACANAARLNGVSGYINRSLGAIGSWGTINAAIEDAGGITLDPKQAMETLNPRNMGGSMKRLSRMAARASANMALDAVGLSITEDNKVKMTDARGLVLATHAVERATGSAATLIARQHVRGKPYMKYQGVLVRKNPLASLPSPKTMSRLSKGRVTLQPQEGYYFHRDGITWSSSTSRVKVFKGGGEKTLSVLKSWSFPNREFYFDRRLDERDAVDLAMGHKSPETLPGYLGHTTELDSLLRPIKRAKQALLVANWLTVDDSERDIPYDTIVDYDRLFQKKQRPLWGDYYYGNAGALDYTSLRRGYRSASYRDLIKRNRAGKQKKKTGKRSAAIPTPSAPTGKIKKTIKYADLVNEVGEDLVPDTIRMPGYDEPLPLKIEAIDEYSDGSVYAEAYAQAPDKAWFPIVDQAVQKRLGRLVLNNFTAKSWSQYRGEGD